MVFLQKMSGLYIIRLEKMYICVNGNNLITIALWVNPEEAF